MRFCESRDCHVTRVGVILRDSFGVAQVKWVTGNKILRILKAKGRQCNNMYMQLLLLIVTGLAPSLPEDLYHLIKKAVSIRKHMEKHRKVLFICYFGVGHIFKNFQFQNVNKNSEHCIIVIFYHFN